MAWESLTLVLPKYEIKTLGNSGLPRQKTNIGVHYVGITYIMQFSSWETLMNYLVRGVQFGGRHLQETLRDEFYVVIYPFFQCLVFTSFDAFICRIDKLRY